MAKKKMHVVEGSPVGLLSTHDALVHSALTCFSARGFSASSIQDIATLAGVAKGNVYHYFSTKEDVLRLILHRVIDDHLGAFDQILYDESTFAEQLSAYMRVVIDLVGRNRGGTAIFVQERRRLSAEAFADVLARSDEMADKLGDLLQRGIDRGEVRSLSSPKGLAVGLIGMVTWTYQWYEIGGRLNLADIADMYAAVVLDGLALPTSERGPEPPRAIPCAIEDVDGSPVSTREACAIEDVDGSPVSTREALVRAALDLFLVKGYDHTSITKLSERAKVTSGAFYSQFAKKDEILRYIAIRYLDRLLASFDQVVAQGLGPSETLARFIVEIMSNAGDHRTELTIFLQERPLLGSGAFPDVRAKSAQLVQNFVTVLQEGERQGTFRALRSPRVTAYGLIGMCSFPFQWSEPVIHPEIDQMYAQVILQGLRARDAVPWSSAEVGQGKKHCAANAAQYKPDELAQEECIASI